VPGCGNFCFAVHYLAVCVNCAVPWTVRRADATITDVVSAVTSGCGQVTHNPARWLLRPALSEAHRMTDSLSMIELEERPQDLAPPPCGWGRMRRLAVRYGGCMDLTMATAQAAALG